MIWAIRAFWSREEDDEEELEEVLDLLPEAVPAEDVALLRELIERNPSCLSVVAENPMAPAS